MQQLPGCIFSMDRVLREESVNSLSPPSGEKPHESIELNPEPPLTWLAGSQAPSEKIEHKR